jgi:RNA polymerase subunit RPABC4/transcription elongation factor Spt4
LYRQIGKKVYEKHLLQDTINIKEDLEEECTKIDILSDENENTLKEIMSLRDLKQCSNCYEKIDKSAKYCPNCGYKQEEIKQEQEDSAKEVEVVDVEEAHQKAEHAEEVKEETIDAVVEEDINNEDE